MRKTIVPLTLAVAFLIWDSNRVGAGPIGWSYSSQGDRDADDLFFLVGQSLTRTETAAGEISTITPYLDYGPKVGFVNNTFVNPELTTRVTLTDEASGDATEFDVPYTFSSNPADEIFPMLDGFETQQFTLGSNIYAISPFENQQLGVSIRSNGVAVVEAPEPDPVMPILLAPVEPILTPIDPIQTVTSVGESGAVVATPEPATLLLAGLGLTGLGATRFRKKILLVG